MFRKLWKAIIGKSKEESAEEHFTSSVKRLLEDLECYRVPIRGPSVVTATSQGNEDFFRVETEILGLPFVDILETKEEVERYLEDLDKAFGVMEE